MNIKRITFLTCFSAMLLASINIFGNLEEKFFNKFEENSQTPFGNLQESDIRALQNLIIEKYEENEVVSENRDLTPKDLTPAENVKDKIDESTSIGSTPDNIASYQKQRPANLTFNYKYDKNSPKDMDEFVFVKSETNIRKAPGVSSGILKKAAYSEKYKVLGKVADIENGTSEWYEIEVNGGKGYVISTNMIKRKFDWEDMLKRVSRTNRFITDSLSQNKKIYVLDSYVPLGGGSGGNKDKFGNRENQSERGYLNSSLTGNFINIPDRSIMTITEETDKYVKVKIDIYDNVEYYLRKSGKKILKDSGISGEITRFIYVDRESQNEIVIEKNSGSESWNVVTSSFVTTGKDASDSYATPYGAFLIAHSKPVMQYTGSDNKTVVGDAKYAVRFSGGGYMHGIPSVFEPKNTREQRKAATARKIGTYPESHKCIRHYDDQIKFIYDWLGNSTPGDKNGFRVPEVPTMMLVK